MIQIIARLPANSMLYEMHQSSLTPADAAWLHMEAPDNLMSITGVIMLERAPELERLKAILEERFLIFERFRMRVVESSLGLGLPRWEAYEDFQIESHLFYEELPEKNQLGLNRRVGELMSSPLPRERALWEMRVFPELKEGAAVVVRLHHAIADGIALIRVLLALTDEDPLRASPFDSQLLNLHREPERTGLWYRARRRGHQFLQASHELVVHPARLARLAGFGWKAARSLARILALRADTENSLRGQLQVQKSAVVSQPLEVEAIKKIGHRLGGTVNDVLLAVLAGGLRRNLDRRQVVPPNMEVRVVAPVDLRGGKACDLGNRFGLVFVTLPLGERDPKKCLQAVRRHMERVKCSAEALITYELLNAVGVLPAGMERPIIDWFANKASAVVTNLHGPDQVLYLTGIQLKSLMYWVPQSGRLGLGVSILSYNGQVRVGVAVDAGLFPHPQELLDDFDTAFEEFVQLEGT